MNIGILTFHRAINAGAVLQAYATQQTIRMMGHNAFIIDYRPEYIEKAYKPLRTLSLAHPRGLIYELLSAPLRAARIREYNHFIKECLQIRPLPELANSDIVILGSDQIWNPGITGGAFDPIFFNCAEELKAKEAMAYAASTMSLSRLNDTDKTELSNLLPKLKAVGVRERGLGDFIEKNYGIAVTEVLDPTLLAGKAIFDSMLNSLVPKEEYLLFYEVWHNDEIERKARVIAREKGLKFVGLTGGDIIIPRKGMCQVFSPSDMVQLIANSSHVITSSFHGTAFSLIYEKPFNVVCEEPHQAVRMQELLRLIGRPDLITFKDENVSESLPDYKRINTILANRREESMRFIERNLV